MSAATILAARQRITGLIAPTPLERSASLSALLNTEVFLKLECAPLTGSFKVRGAADALLTQPRSIPVVACSAGNHALGVAYAASALGVEATLIFPTTASAAKIRALQRYFCA